ncbi:MAG: GNAT family N-acetyltransferase [Anaerolineae bacterium]|jgi:ribosomal protein S18 acetylase RimI-like enzyme|nr:GNAT family N-acetyltransferase [Chloroflexota bacterium]
MSDDIAQRHVRATHIRRFEPSLHLAALADLVESSFAEDLARTRNPITAEMREMATWGPLLRLPGVMGRQRHGLVWVEQDTLLGNVSITHEGGGVWSLSNIAVVPEARGRGIASALVDETIARLRHRGARYVVLQVRPDNAIARGLYQRRGFILADRVHELVLTRQRWPLTVAVRSTPMNVRAATRRDRPGITQLVEMARPPLWQRVQRYSQRRRWALWSGSLWRALSTGIDWADRCGCVAEGMGQLVGAAWMTVRPWSPVYELGLALSRQATAALALRMAEWLFGEMDHLVRKDVHATVSTQQTEALEALRSFGFETMRVLDRMVLSLGDAEVGLPG